MKIERVKCDICGKEFDRNKPMAYLNIILHTRPVGMENDDSRLFDICDSCCRTYEKEINNILDVTNRMVIMLRLKERTVCDYFS